MGHRVIISFLLAFNCLYYVHAQDFWEALPVPDSLHIQSIAINNRNHIFISSGSATSNSGLYRSTDGGQSWELIFDNGEIMINPIEINPEGDIYIGRGGFDPLRISYDNGDTWDSLFYPGIGNLSAMYSPGHDTLFVGGAHLVRTYDNASTWDTIFTIENGTEYIKDILQTQSGDMYIALTAYFPDMGGVYKSTDDGNNWELSGLFNYMVSSLAENNEGDVFAGVRGILQSGLSPGLFVLRSGEDAWEELLGGPSIEDVVINSSDQIYASSSQVIRSLDDGQSFEYFEEGLFPGPKGDMIKDELDYLYVTSEFSSNALYRTINPTVSIAEGHPNFATKSLILYPNPAREHLFIKNLVRNDGHNNIRVYNEIGALVLQTKIETGSNLLIINTIPLKPGIYFIEAFTENKNRIGRFIIY